MWMKLVLSDVRSISVLVVVTQLLPRGEIECTGEVR